MGTTGGFDTKKPVLLRPNNSANNIFKDRLVSEPESFRKIKKNMHTQKNSLTDKFKLTKQQGLVIINLNTPFIKKNYTKKRSLTLKDEVLTNSNDQMLEKYKVLMSNSKKRSGQFAYEKNIFTTQPC